MSTTEKFISFLQNLQDTESGLIHRNAYSTRKLRASGATVISNPFLIFGKVGSVAVRKAFPESLFREVL
jgi:hypothetical protein